MTTLIAERKPQTETIEVHICCSCGKTGTGMVGHYSYIGGQGNIMIYECQDCLNETEEGSRIAVEALKTALRLGK